MMGHISPNLCNLSFHFGIKNISEFAEPHDITRSVKFQGQVETSILQFNLPVMCQYIVSNVR